MFCDKELPQGSNSRRMFCDDSHRTKYWRENSARSPKRKRAKDENGANARVGASRKDKRDGRKAAASTSETARECARRLSHSDVSSSSPAWHRKALWAIDWCYRHALPDDVPRLSPPLDANGYQGHYSLRPFQAPYDIRLIDGQIYRVVWIGASGEVIPPKPDGTIPGLHFFPDKTAQRQWRRSRIRRS